jgi:hypothetical protein
MKKGAKQQAGAKRRAKRRSSKLLTWIVVVGVVALIGYGLSQMSNIAFNEQDLTMIDFTDLTSTQRRTALEAANAARCTCGCGMTLAQCVATDATCPVRVNNIDRIKGMVAQAHTQHTP